MRDGTVASATALDSTRLALAVQSTLVATLTAFACVTVATHAAQVAGLAFSTFAPVVLLLSGATGLAAALLAPRPLGATGRAEAGVVGTLAALVLASAVLALFSHRADVDDVNYVPNALHYLTHPQTPMGFAVHYVLGENGQPPTSLFQSTALPFEYLQAALAHHTGLPLLAVRYFALPTLLGGLLPLVWVWVLWRLGATTRNAVLGAVAVLALLLLLGDTFRSYGNYAWVRLHMGKAVLMTVILPVFAAAMLGYLRAPNRTCWWMLFGCATSGVGLTGSAIPLLAALAALVAVAHWLASSPARPPWRATATAAIATLYLVGYAIAVLSHARDQLGAAALLNEDWPTDFWSHARFMYAGRPPASALAVVSCLPAAWWLSDRYMRRVLVVWCGVAVCTLLNPLLAPFLIEQVTSPNIYWRLFYLLPFPLAAGLAASGSFARATTLRRATALAVTFVAVTTALHWVPHSPSVYHDRPGDQHSSRLSWPRYDLDTAKLEVAGEISEAAADGVMLAPLRIAAYVPMLNAEMPQVITRRSEMLMWITGLGQPRSIPEQRLSAADYLGGTGGELADLEAVLDRHAVRTLVADRQVAERAELRAALARRSWRESARVQDYVLFTPR